MTRHVADGKAFEEWVTWVFDHPVTDPEWYQGERIDWWEGSAVVRLEFITRLFEAAPAHLRRFSDAQANQGLWFLSSSIFFDGLSIMFDEAVLRSHRQRCLASIIRLFKEYFAARCSPQTSLESEVNPLNETCFMWWDFVHHLPPKSDQPGSEIDREILSALTQILAIGHDACTQSALHGLGHWQSRCPEEVAAIIDSFLLENQQLRPELQRYAVRARSGSIA